MAENKNSTDENKEEMKMEEKFDGYIQQVKKTQEYYKTKNPVAKDDEVNLTYAEIKAIAAGQKNLQPDEKWQLKKQYAEKRLESLNKKLNENFPDKLIAIFKDGLKVHCPHGKVKQFVSFCHHFAINNCQNLLFYYSSLPNSPSMRRFDTFVRHERFRVPPFAAATCLLAITPAARLDFFAFGQRP